MQASKATALYNEFWDKEFTTMEDLYARIQALAENGAYTMCVYIDSKSQYNEVYAKLSQAGYGVDHYNGGNNGIIEVSWGS